MSSKEIKINRANVHNLKDISLNLPKNKLIVVTGPSGSGKSSLAFDTIYVEGQRRYLESLSSHAKQFIGQFQPPEVESITGLSPAIAIDQKTISRNPRSTVGTITEIYDYMRVLFARVGTLYCLKSNEKIVQYTPAQILSVVLSKPLKTKVQILSPIRVSTKSELKENILKLQSSGFSKIVINDSIHNLDDNILESFDPKSSYHVIVDRVILKENSEKRLMDSIEHALSIGFDTCSILFDESNRPQIFSNKNISPTTGEEYPDLGPKLFSFNSPQGACPDCKGLGQAQSFDTNIIISNEDYSINEGAIPPLSNKSSMLYKIIKHIADLENIDLGTPYKKLPKSFINILFNGSGNKRYKFDFSTLSSQFNFSKSFPGIIEWLKLKYAESSSEKIKKELESYMVTKICSSCQGNRLRPISLNVFLEDNKSEKYNIADLNNLSLFELNSFFKNLELDDFKYKVAHRILKEISNRLQFLNDVGLGYLTLNRGASTLSGGEGQRIRLATQIGSALSGVLYILDEPSIGLHQRDNQKLIQTLKSLRDIGNTVIVVEHDEDTMREADYIVDLGPGAGVHGGTIVAEGTPASIIKSSDSITSDFLSGKKFISANTNPKYKLDESNMIILTQACENNLKSVDLKLPLNKLVCLTGVSGSGKSTLIHNILVPALKAQLLPAHRSLYIRNNFKSLQLPDSIKSVIELDQSPIGRTPHSNPATYTGLFDDIRKLYTKTQESQIRGYKPGRFSFNVKGGRCEDCEGNGVNKIEMHFLPDIHIECSTCKGSRYNEETLSVLYRGKNIADVLNMTIEEGVDFFINHPKIHRALKTMNSVGLGYIKLGQPATTLSGGEAQRLKLSRELSKRTKGDTLYILDEPTTGLHFEDIKILLKTINSLVEQGHSVLIIEHNLDVIKTADWVIDLGPDGGDKGGEIVAEGTPEEISKASRSETGKFLKNYFN